MSKTLLVTSGKGGTGKTTVSMLLARELCSRGKNVLLLELDSGLRGLDLLLGVSDKVVYDLSDVLCGRCKPVKAITVCETEKGNLHLIAAPINRHFIPDKTNLEILLKGLSGCYDWLFLDSAAGLGKGFDIAKSVSDGAIIVTNLDNVSVRDAAVTAQMLEPLPSRLVVNRFSRKQLGNDLPDLDAVIDAVGSRLISVIPEDPLLASHRDSHASPPASSPLLQEITDLADRLMGERIKLRTDRFK